MKKFESVLDRVRARALSQVEAAGILGMSERTFRRWRDRFEAGGLEGLFDRRLDKASERRAPVDEIAWMVEQYRTRHVGWTVKHFHDHLKAHHGFSWGYTWAKTQLHAAGLVRKARRRGVHRRKRARRPMVGMMVHQDGSTHAWLDGHGALDLIVTLDDATSEIHSAFLVEEEGTASSFQGLLEVIAAKGLPCSLYTDRGSHYFHTAEAGAKVDKDNPTQVGRALAQLGIEPIAAYSPEARGRSERAFGTLQGRLPQELRVAGVTTMEQANRYLAKVYLAAHNARFAVAAEQPGSAFVADRAGAWRAILCVHETRTVGNDNCVRYRGLSLQIPEHAHRHHFVKVKVRVHDYPDGTLAVFHGPRCLARHDQEGKPIDDDAKRAA